ncbi:hypothetical protein LSAT2_014850 [Lamellibrachia satsuma]|nr:hypothetical protein LSAT2_014850 [Lamellibrachia satsuma]
MLKLFITLSVMLKLFITLNVMLKLFITLNAMLKLFITLNVMLKLFITLNVMLKLFITLNVMLKLFISATSTTGMKLLFTPQTLIVCCAMAADASRNKMAVSDPAAGDALIRLVDEKFDLVLIMEHIDESLVLMKRRLCWTLKDILYLPLLVEKYEGKANGKEEDQEQLIARHRDWSPIDYAIYDHFARKLQTQIAFENNLDDEVEMFRQARNRTTNFCRGLRDLLYEKPHNKRRLLRVQEYLNSTIQFDRTPYNEPFSVTGLDCFLMMIHNDIYRKALTVKQLPEVCELVASQPNRFKRKAEQEIMPHEIGRDGTLPFAIPPSFCRDIFAYTFPRFLVKGYPSITWR